MVIYLYNWRDQVTLRQYIFSYLKYVWHSYNIAKFDISL